MNTTSEKQIKVCLEGAVSALQDSFENNDWNIFKEPASYEDHIDLE